MGASGQQCAHRGLILKHDVEISFGRTGRVSFARFNPDGAKGFERVEETLVRDVPGNSAQEDLGAVERVLMLPRRQLS